MRDVWRSVVLVLGVAAVVAAIVLLRPKAPARGPLTPEEAAVVSAFTGGTISRESPIRVVFNDPLGRGRSLNTPLEPSPFRFEPRLEGVAVWTAPNRIEFRPAERLEEGRTYAAHLDLGALLGADAPLPLFDFTFSAMRQSFSVTVDGLVAADLTDIAQQRLTGRLVTADVEADAKVEEMLTASHRGRDLEIAWDHHPDRRSHAFVVQGIVRGDEASTVELRWDGSPDRRGREGGARGRGAGARHLHRSPGSRGAGARAARRAAFHRPPAPGPEPGGAGPHRRPRRPPLRHRAGTSWRSTAPAASPAS